MQKNLQASKKTIYIIGGHVTPALSVCDELIKRGWSIYYVGRKYALEGDSALSFEYNVVRKRGIPLRVLTTGRVPRIFSWRAFVSLFKIPLGFVQAFRYLAQDKPQLILAFGGYVAVPIVIAGWIMGIPSITHEQTFTPGLANRLLGYFVKKVCLSWEETRKYFPKPKVVVTGTPLRTVIFEVKTAFPIDINKPLLYITGGSLGAHSLNVEIEKILEQLLAHFSVIHQCGAAKEFKDYERLSRYKAQLPPQLQRRYLPVEHVDEDHIGWVYKYAAALVARAGANTIAEIIILAKPTLFIPLPWSGAGEQLRNAQYLVERKAALMLAQSAITPNHLVNTIQTLFMQRTALEKQLKQLASLVPLTAASRIADVIES